MKPMHPKMVARAAAVKSAHAYLTKMVPGFSTLHPHTRIKAVHAHINRLNPKPKI